jgi:hypothetical protein
VGVGLANRRLQPTAGAHHWSTVAGGHVPSAAETHGVGNVAKSIRFELNDFEHRFHQDSSREIWKRYTRTHLEPTVASAVAAGVLRKEELPAQLVQHIEGLIEFYEHDLSAS